MINIQRKDDSVNLNVSDLFLPAVPVLKTAWRMIGLDCVVTSGMDGKHSVKSAHYIGDALDLRIIGISFHMTPMAFALNLSKALVENCGPNYFVVLESDHIHCEVCTLGGTPNIKGYEVGKNYYEKASQ